MFAKDLFDILNDELMASDSKGSQGTKQRCERCGSTVDVKRVHVSHFALPGVTSKCLCLKCRMMEMAKRY